MPQSRSRNRGNRGKDSEFFARSFTLLQNIVLFMVVFFGDWWAMGHRG